MSATTADLVDFLSALTGVERSTIAAPGSEFAVREADDCADCGQNLAVSRVLLENDDELDLCLDCLVGRL